MSQRIKGLGVAALIATMLVPTYAGAQKAPETAKHIGPCGPLVSTTDGAHKRAQQGWDSKALKTRAGKIAKVRLQARCVPEGKPEEFVRSQIEKAQKQYKEALAAQAATSSLTPYDCGSAGSFAIPCYIVECESGYSWNAANPSGAVGPYQLLGWGAPYPADTKAEKMKNHRIAAELWAGGAGASNWVCA